MHADQVAKIVDAVSEGFHVVSVAVPTRALRILRDDLSIKFRVEQLDPTNWSWRPVSTHAGDVAWESFEAALADMAVKQTRLKEKIKLAQHEHRMAMVKAQNPTGASL